jgi:hypothetical protein
VTRLTVPGEHPRVLACGLRRDPATYSVTWWVWVEVDPHSYENRTVTVRWYPTGYGEIPDGYGHVGTVIDYEQSGTVWHCYALTS